MAKRKSRSPRGERGLKFNGIVSVISGVFTSLPARGAWIEILFLETL